MTEEPREELVELELDNIPRVYLELHDDGRREIVVKIPAREYRTPLEPAPQAEEAEA